MQPLLAVGDLLAAIPRPPAWVGVTLIVAFLAWPVGIAPVDRSDNIDISWITAIHVAAHEGLRFGSEFNFVYGPLGYLTFSNLFYDDTGLVAAVVVAIVYLVSVGLVARATSGAFGLALGAVITFVIARIALSPIDRVELLPGILVATTALAVHRARGAPPAWQGFALGALAAFCELVKLSAGSLALVVVAVLALVGLLGDRPWRARLQLAAAPVAGVIAGLLVLWLVADEALWDIVPYLRNSVDFVTGNVDAMSDEAPGLRGEYLYAAVAIVALMLAAALDARRLPLWPALGLVAIWLVFAYVNFRHGFTSHSPGHAVLFFWPVLLGAAAAFPTTGGRTVALIACLPLALGGWKVAHIDPWSIVRTSSDPAVTHFELVTSSAKRHALQRASRASLRKSYGFPHALVERMRGQTVHFDPWEAAVAWAFPEFDWRPAPVLQSFSAYTERLDRLNADFLAGDEAPRYVLRENATLRNRNSRFESPAYQLELICRYREVMTTKRWQLLERGPSRCSRPVSLDRRRVRFGERVAVPPVGGAIITVSFRDFDLPLGDRIRKRLFKGRSIWISPRPGIMNRLVTGHAASPHVMTVPSCLGWSQSLFDATPFTPFAVGWMPGTDRGQFQGPLLRAEPRVRLVQMLSASHLDKGTHAILS